ncbi:MAG: glycosyltransferase [Paludibacteraceae bacterium]|nr:glycosyltransferase [Paludibacteraceae bacterium]MBR5824618.1 glycosyltransferase [Paludibacteraceae bacterium]
MPLVSIIVPVYKAERWLHRCVDSILAQTMTDFELLLINDGSPDKSGEICDDYATKDSRIRVFHKENGGVSSARNLGLDNAQGEWISFIDADDWVEKEYLAMLTERLDVDFITGGLQETIGNIYQLDDELFCQKEIGQFLKKHNGDIFVRAACGKLIKKQIIDNNHLRFDKKNRFGEDAFFNREVILNSDSVRCVSFVGYNYYIPEGQSVLIKYSMSFEEVEYAIKVIKNINEKIISLYGDCIEKNEWRNYFIQALRFNDIIRVGNKKYYELCRSYNSDLTETQFYADSILSPICKGIVKLKEFYLNGKIEDTKTFFEKLRKFYVGMPWVVKFKFIDFYLWYFLIKCGWWNLFNFLMENYCKIK